MNFSTEEIVDMFYALEACDKNYLLVQRMYKEIEIEKEGYLLRSLFKD